MKLKYYLRGIGIGVILTATIMGFALGGRKTIMSDAQVIQRAKELGMTEGGVLSAEAGETNNNGSSTTSLSVETLDKKGKENTEEVNKAVAAAGKSVSAMEEKAKEETGKSTENKSDKNESASKTDTQEESKTAVASTASSKETVKEAKAEETKKTEENTEKKTETASAAVSAETPQTENKTSEETPKEIVETTELPATTENTEVAGNTPSEENTESTTGEFTTSISKTVTIPGGLGSDAVARLLYNEGVVDSAIAFDSYLTTNRLDRNIRSGIKVIPSGASYADIAAILTKG
jgi:hypothetical protein